MGELSLEHSKSEKLYTDELFLSKAYNVSARKFQRNNYVMTLKGDAKSKGKLTCSLRNNLMNLLNFHASSWKSRNGHFDGLLSSKTYKYLDKKVQSFVSQNWRVIQTLKKNWLFVWKMTWGIWWTLTQAAESLKICTLMDYFCRNYVVF